MDVIIHCSDSDFGNAVMIDGWHAIRGFKNADGIHIGYHLVILNGWLTKKKYNKYCDGLVETGRALDDDDKFEWDEVAAATLGKNDCIQICLIGKTGKFTTSQMSALRKKINELREQFGTVNVGQHSDYEPKKPFCAGLTREILISLNTI
jgi:N-acetylmuramoyl-L-alanine amidase